MPTITPDINAAIRGITTKWSGLATNDDGTPVATEGRNLSVQVTGTFAGATVAMQGSNDGANWVALNDQAVPGNPCSFTSAGLKGVLQMPKYIKPVVSGGAGTGLIVTLFNRD